MQVIPVLDLKGGLVVHARMGAREHYRPIRTPLSPTSNPNDVARGLLSVYPFSSFYIADLDAIAGAGNNDAVLAELKASFPHSTFWVDNGIADRASAERWLDADLGHLVLGSETQRDEAVLRRLCKDDRIVLSLDYRGDDFVGPAALLNNVDAWPSRSHCDDACPRRQRTGPRLGAARGDQKRRPRKARLRGRWRTRRRRPERTGRTGHRRCARRVLLA